MKKTIVLILMAFLFSFGLGAEVIEKNSETDRAVASAISKTSAVVEEVVTYTVSMLKESKGFVKEQIPLVVREFMVWRMSQAIFWASIWIIIATIGFFAASRAKRAIKSDWSSDDRVTTVVIANIVKWVISPFILIVGVGTNVFEIIYITVAPRVYLIENLVHLLKYGQVN